MTSPHWPLTGLRLRTPRLELRWPSLEDLDELVTLAAAGVHDPQVQPFSAAWTDVAAAELPARSLRFFWSQWASWQPANWEISFVVVHQGDIVGVQGLKAADFAILREVHTGSWIGRRYQGRGIGTEMRAAVLSLAFDDLHAQYARSTAHSDNAASLGVSRKLGYVDDGIEHFVVRGQAINAQRAPARPRDLAGPPAVAGAGVRAGALPALVRPGPGPGGCRGSARHPVRRAWSTRGLTRLSTRSPTRRPTPGHRAAGHAGGMNNTTMYVINAVLVLMVVRQIREHPLDLRSLAGPVLAVGAAAVLFLHSVPGGGNDIALELACVAAGATMGAVAGLTTKLRRGPTAVPWAAPGGSPPACGSPASAPGWPSPSPPATARARRSPGSASRTRSPARPPGSPR